jgi:hypothetical protein
MRNLIFILGISLIISSCTHTINNYECKCDGTCCQPQDSTCVVQGSDVLEEQTDVIEEGEQ